MMDFSQNDDDNDSTYTQNNIVDEGFLFGWMFSHNQESMGKTAKMYGPVVKLWQLFEFIMVLVIRMRLG
jgi:hypothetical protein